MTDEEIEAIRKRAEAATPGPWYHCQPFQTVPAQRTIHGPVPKQRVDYVSTWEGPGTPNGHSVVAHMDGREAGMRSKDMAFIAAANPAVVLALLSAIEAEKKRADEAEALVRLLEDDETVAIITTLRARVAIMQEALEIIAGKRQCLDNLMSNKDVALAALKGASHGQR